MRHNVILFALSLFHVPIWCSNLIFQYYNALFASVATSNWTTSLFPFEIGVFQGCTISPILFDLVYQLCIDFVDKHGLDPYVFSRTFDFKKKFGIIELSQLVYADDHTIINRSISGAQLTLYKIHQWLSWTNCMNAKPSKCRSLSFCYSTSLGSSTFGPVKAHLTIGADHIPDIADTPFKFLGRLISKDSNDLALRDSVRESFTKYIKKLDTQLLLGAAKAWIYNNYILAFMSWPFLVYDFPPSFADELTSTVNRHLKKWLKVHHPASPEIFYLTETGLKLKHLKTFLKCMQLTKQHI